MLSKRTRKPSLPPVLLNNLVVSFAAKKTHPLLLAAMFGLGVLGLGWLVLH